MTHTNPNPEEPLSKHDPGQQEQHHSDQSEANKMQSQCKPCDNSRHPTEWSKAEQVLWWIHRTSGLTAQTPECLDPVDRQSDAHSDTDTTTVE
jgi:hypothetical protein